ncbi:MAG: T9SS type A sorting domain-containing protein [Bacteroidales bacterium]|nr:T9SS type A sorting domain-containing protein [Bacteroidales bacterium]
MKKLLLAFIALFFVGTAFSQQQAVKLSRQEAAKMHVSVPLHQTPSATPQNFVPKNLRGNTLPYFTIGQTRYDMQTNGCLPQRLITFNDGTSAATWTTCGTSSSSRGSGYNYYNGTSWALGSGSGAPINRIESVRTGWPTIAPIGENGEIVISHNGSTGLVVSVRPNKGTGDWSETLLQGPSIYDSYIGGNSTALLWPSVATNGNTIHLIACTESDTVSLYQGIQTCLVYYRGTYNPSDNTITWENPRIVADMANHLDWFNGFSGDSYVIVANGNTVAVVYAEAWTDAFMWKSTDNGENWTTTTIVNSVVPDNFDEDIHLIDTIDGPAYVTDGSFAAAIDDNGKVHAAFGLTAVANYVLDDGYINLYFGAGGLFYWNENMPTIDAQTNYQLDPDTLAAHGYPVFPSRLDLDGNDGLYGLSQPSSETYSFDDYHRAGPASMPSLAVDGNNVYLIWASCLEYPFMGVNASNTPAYYRGIFGAKSINGGTSFEDGISWISYNKSCYYVDWDLYDWDPDASEWNDGSIEMEGENVYPSIAQNIVNGKLNIIWHSDYFPGNAQGGVSQNDPTLVLFTSIDADQLGVYNNIEEIPQGLWIDTWTGIADNTLSGMQLYPNPASDNVNVVFSSKEDANATLTIHNLMGQQVYSESIAIQEGSNVVKINTSNFQAGVYMVNIKSNQGTTTQKLIVR